ncbi:MAG: RpiB/LacA/LacB family sugar-phosphate isomerase [Planctomycetes bacterium]|nr:RpiB/LacA/LacB family sugar-phosphate isomerase [Planctomycetota bacterium]
MLVAVEAAGEEGHQAGASNRRAAPLGEDDAADHPALELRRVAARQADLGVLCCGTGIGMSISANKVPGIRAANCHNDYTAEMARRHNDANVLCMGGRVLDDRAIAELVRRFIRTPFDGGRHARRINKIADIERNPTV